MLDVKEELFKAKYAESAVKSFLSQEDHRERMRFTAYNDGMRKHLKDYEKRNLEDSQPCCQGGEVQVDHEDSPQWPLKSLGGQDVVCLPSWCGQDGHD